jgi:hypothetical protein
LKFAHTRNHELMILIFKLRNSTKVLPSGDHGLCSLHHYIFLLHSTMQLSKHLVHSTRISREITLQENSDTRSKKVYSEMTAVRVEVGRSSDQDSKGPKIYSSNQYVQLL